MKDGRGSILVYIATHIQIELMGSHSSVIQHTGLFPFFVMTLNSLKLHLTKLYISLRMIRMRRISLCFFFQSGGAQALPPSNKNYAVKMVRRPFLLDYSTGVQWPAPLKDNNLGDHCQAPAR